MQEISPKYFIKLSIIGGKYFNLAAVRSLLNRILLLKIILYKLYNNLMKFESLRKLLRIFFFI